MFDHPGKAVRHLQYATGSPSLLTGRKNDTATSTQLFFAVIERQQQEGQLRYDDGITTSNDHNSAQRPKQQTCNVARHQTFTS